MIVNLDVKSLEVVVTGRLSSSKPNLQNADKQTKKYMESRYE